MQGGGINSYKLKFLKKKREKLQLFLRRSDV